MEMGNKALLLMEQSPFSKGVQMQDLVLASVLIICSITDLLYQKIYNLVLVPAVLFALAYNLYVGGWLGLRQSLLGLVVGLLILIIPFAMGGIGAGDVKLLGFIGALKGAVFVIYSAIGMGLAGGMIALGIWFYRFGVVDTIGSVLKGIWTMIRSGFTIFPFRLHNEKIIVPYGLAIALGTLGAWWWMR